MNLSLPIDIRNPVWHELPGNNEPITVIVCCNSELICLGVIHTLERDAEFKVISHVRDLRAATERIIEMRPSILLLVDISVPAFDLQETERIKREAPEIRLAMLTSHTDDEHALSALQAGVGTYCLATAPSEHFYAALKAMSYGASWLDPGVADRVLQLSRTRNREPAGYIKNAPSPREQEVLSLLAGGMSNKEIARTLVVSVETVKSHVRHLMEKFSAKHRTQVVVQAMRQGLLDS